MSSPPFLLILITLVKLLGSISLEKAAALENLNCPSYYWALKTLLPRILFDARCTCKPVRDPRLPYIYIRSSDSHTEYTTQCNLFSRLHEIAGVENEKKNTEAIDFDRDL